MKNIVVALFRKYNVLYTGALKKNKTPAWSRKEDASQEGFLEEVKLKLRLRAQMSISWATLFLW